MNNPNTFNCAGCGCDKGQLPYTLEIDGEEIDRCPIYDSTPNDRYHHAVARSRVALNDEPKYDSVTVDEFTAFCALRK